MKYSIAYSCFESVLASADSTSNDEINIYDGACCENSKTNETLCCVVGLTNLEDKASIKK